MSEKIQLQSSSLYDYLNWRGDLPFDKIHVGEVDGLILSVLSYIDFTGFVSEDTDLSKKLPILLNVTRDYLRAQNGAVPNIGLLIPKEIVALLARAAKTPRYGLIRPFAYVNRISDEEQKQFSAVCFALDNNDTFVSFRGTDDTLVGWKENFNMSFMSPVPAQKDAVEYLENVAAATNGRLYVGGHSKGGNLAVYAAVKAKESTKERIAAVYNNDGPGFDTDFVKCEDYRSIKGKIFTFVPQSSVVGMLLEHEESYTVVKSHSVGIFQHNGLSWEVLGNSFVKLDSITEDSKLIDRSIKALLKEMDANERELVAESLYDSLSSQGVKTLSDIGEDKLKLVRAWSAMDNDARNLVRKCINIILGKKKQSKEAK